MPDDQTNKQILIVAITGVSLISIGGAIMYLFVFKRKKIDCVVAAPLVAPYMDRMFEIILHDDEELPKVGTIIDVCLPGDVEVLDTDNRYIMAGHYEIRSQDAT